MTRIIGKLYHDYDIRFCMKWVKICAACHCWRVGSFNETYPFACIRITHDPQVRTSGWCGGGYEHTHNRNNLVIIFVSTCVIAHLKSIEDMSNKARGFVLTRKALSTSWRTLWIDSSEFCSTMNEEIVGCWAHNVYGDAHVDSHIMWECHAFFSGMIDSRSSFR